MTASSFRDASSAFVGAVLPSLALLHFAVASSVPCRASDIDLQIGPDLRVSYMGLTGETIEDGLGASEEPVVAYNATDDEFLVAWSGTDDLVAGTEIFIRRVDAQTGAMLSGELRISDTGSDGDLSRQARDPSVAWDSSRNRYLVVWSADGGGLDGEHEVYGQLIDADGSEAGVDDFRITQTGLDGDADADAEFPNVVYNPDLDQYLVVWLASGDGTELRAQHVDAGFPLVFFYTPSLVTAKAQRLNLDVLSSIPDVVYNPLRQQYVVVWSVNTIDGDEQPGYQAIFAQRLRASDLERLVVFDRQISDPDQVLKLHVSPSIAHDPHADRYFIVWYRTFIPFTTPFSPEVYGELRTGISVGPIGDGADQQLTQVGQDDSWHYSAWGASVAFDATAREYLVAFEADHDIDDEYQIRALLFDQDGQRKSPTPPWGRQLSEMDGAGGDYDGYAPEVAAAGGRALVVWFGDDDTLGPGDGDQEYEIFAQPTQVPGFIFADGFESGLLCSGGWQVFPPQCLSE